MKIVCKSPTIISTNLLFLNNDLIDIIIVLLDDGKYLLKNEDLINEIYNENFLKDLKQGKIRFDTIHFDINEEYFFKKVSSINEKILNNFAKELYGIQFLALNY